MKQPIASFCFMWGLVTLGCTSAQAPDFLVAMGRAPLAGMVEVQLGDTTLQPEVVNDNAGAMWARLRRDQLPAHGTLSVTWRRNAEALPLFAQPAGSAVDAWLSPSRSIDSDAATVQATALQVTAGASTRIEKALAIQAWVGEHLRYSVYRDSFLDTASRSHELGFGSCMNFARLYVALCRAAGVPARTVWGAVYVAGSSPRYDAHHEWAEVLDDDGYWHPLDFTYTHSFDLNDVRYLPLIYAAEENSVLKHRVTDDEIRVGDVTWFDDYPAALSSRLGFELVSDLASDSMTVRYRWSW